MSSIEDFGVVIHVLRVIRALSQGELAKISGVRNSSISNYERGKSIPKFETIQRLADGLELPLSAVEETQDFIHRMRSLAAAGGGVGPAPAARRHDAALSPVREPAVLQAEVDQLSGDVGRIASRMTRLVLELLAAGTAPSGDEEAGPPPAP